MALVRLKKKIIRNRWQTHGNIVLMGKKKKKACYVNHIFQQILSEKEKLKKRNKEIQNGRINCGTRI